MTELHAEILRNLSILPLIHYLIEIRLGPVKHRYRQSLLLVQLSKRNIIGSILFLNLFFYFFYNYVLLVVGL